MAIIHETFLFSWENLENTGDLYRLELLLRHLPDEKLMDAIEKTRGNGRNDYPVRAVWNSILAGVVLEHKSIASLRRELSRNPLLMQMCGFNPALGTDAIPSDDAYTNFYKSLAGQQELLYELFMDLVSLLTEELEDFGKIAAIDGKAIQSRAKSKSNKPAGDGRRDTDAQWSVKTYGSKNGSIKKVSTFGYTLHLLVDAVHELPIARIVTPGNASESVIAAKLINALPKERLNKMKYCLADKGYDSGKLKLDLLRKHEIKAIIDARDLTQLKYSDIEGSNGRVMYNQKGEVFCCCKESGQLNQMPYVGYESDRETIKYRCPAAHYGIKCPSFGNCTVGNSIRIPLALNPRIFTAVPMDSLKWQNLYKKRTSVERVFSRMDVSFGFEQHYIRGLTKMQMRVDIALITMLGIAHGSVKEGRHKKIRSLVNCIA